MLENIEKFETLSTYKGALKLLKHYDAVYKEYENLKANLDDAKENASKLKVIPEKDFEEPKKSHSILILMIGLILAIALVVVTKMCLIPSGYYYPRYYLFDLSGYEITEVEVVAVLIVVLFLIISLINNTRYVKRYNEYVDKCDEYDKKCREITEENHDEDEKLNELKLVSYKTTLKHLRDEYMKTYADKIPSEYVDIKMLEEKIGELEHAEK